jgi:hypothetical protein
MSRKLSARGRKILDRQLPINSQLARNAKQLSEKSEKSSKLPIPDRWENFARLCRIRSGNRVINFDPYPYQIQLSDAIDNHFGTVVTKSRQLGITEAVACKFLHKACKNPGYAAVILSKSQVDSSNIAKRIRRMVDGLSDYIDLATDSLTDLQIQNGGRLIFRPSTPNGTRGLESISDVLFDEAGFVADIERIYTSTLPATEMLQEQARIVILSTPSGRSGFYWERLNSANPPGKDIDSICTAIKNGQISPAQFWTDENQWCKAVLHWKSHPVYGNIQNYLESIRIKKQLSQSAVEQEYNLSFEVSEVNVFSPDLVRACSTGSFRPPNLYKNSWSESSTYYLGIDTSTTGDDYTVAVVLECNRQSANLVAMYRERKHGMDYHLTHIKKLIADYQPYKIGIEVTGGVGQVYLEELAKFDSSRESVAIRTTKDSKVSMVDRLLLALEQKYLFYPPEPIIQEEFFSFQRSEKGLGAPSGKHDDVVMALAFALSVTPFMERSSSADWIDDL